MKVLQINAVDSIGSTGTIMSDIQDVCTHNGIECHIAYGVTQRSRHDIYHGYHIGNWVDHKLHALLYRITHKQGFYSSVPTWFLLRYIRRLQPDVVHLHNLHSNYINLPMLLRFLAKNDIPTVATLHDNWFHTGECYLPEIHSCHRWQSGCNDCPLHRTRLSRLTSKVPARVLAERKRLWHAIPRLSLVGVSDWMSDEARKSILSGLPITTIRNGVRTDVFRPMPAEARLALRRQYGIADDQFAILASASKWLAPRNRQGLHTILRSLRPDEVLVLYGCTPQQMNLPSLQGRVGVRLLPFISNKPQLSTIYSMADVMINCTHMDTCSFINIECQACGTPVVTFDNTGAAETVDGHTSFRVPTDDYLALLSKAREIRGSHLNPTQWVANRFTMQQNYEAYMRLYKKYIPS